MMTMTMLRPAFLCVILLSSCLTAFSECDQCQFKGNETADCKVYGKIDDRLVAWHKADSDCFDNYNINKILSVGPETVGCDPVSTDKFVDAIGFLFIPNFLLEKLGMAEGGFFDELDDAGEFGGSFELNDEITINGQTYNCVTNKNDCNNAMKTYFASAPGSNEMMDVCEKIIDKYMGDREKEQGDARSDICDDIKAGQDPPTVCGELGNQMVTEVAANPDKVCSDFELGSGNTVIPGCEDEDTPGNDTQGNGMPGDTNPEGDSSRGPHVSLTGSSLLVAAMLLVANVL